MKPMLPSSNKSPVVAKFLAYLRASPSPHHAVFNALQEFKNAGWSLLFEKDSYWNLNLGGKYVLTRNGTSLVAFCIGKNFVTIKT